MHTLTLPQLRRHVLTVWEEICAWLVHKPRVLSLPHPEQQVLFELASRLRADLRRATELPAWDRLFVDGSSLTPDAAGAGLDRHPALYLDTRQLLGASVDGTAASPDLAAALHFFRTAPAELELDPDGQPLHQRWRPTSLRLQGELLEADVRMLEELARSGCDGFAFLVYWNGARRTTALDTRDVASWAAWKEVAPGLKVAQRHFRARR